MRRDLIEIDAVKDPFKRIIIAFNVGFDEATAKEAKDKSLTIIQNNVIYRLIEDYDNFVKQQKEKIKLQKLDTITLPAIIKLLPGHVFHASNPAIVGVEVLEGTIKSGYKLQKDGREIGEIKAVQSENVSIEKASRGERVAVSIEGPTVGRQVKEGDELETVVSKDDVKILEELNMKEEVELARKILSKNLESQ